MASSRSTSAFAPLAPWLVAAAMAGVSTVPAASQDAPPELPRPCETSERHAQLDFWLGEWRVVGDEGQELGRSRIARRHGGCVIEEQWTSARGGGSGEGLSFLDPEDGRWHQVWVGSTGTVVRYEGELRDGAVRFQGRATSDDGTTVLSRGVLEPLPDGRVRQRIERSGDGGATWQRYFEATYVPVGDAGEAAPALEPAPLPVSEAPAPAPAPPVPEPAPAPREPARSGEVTAISVEVPDAEVPVEERSKVHLQSPMVLEVPIGPVESLPAGYSWRTDETGRFVAGGASIRQVTVSRTERRQRVDLRVTPALHGERYLQHAALEVELLVDGEVVASAGLQEFPLGRSLQAQGQGPGLEKSLVLPLDRETFERAFEGDERPVLRLRLTVRD